MHAIAITLHCMHGNYLIVLADSFMIFIWRVVGCQMFVMLMSFENGSIS